ncbi:cold-responsive protein kinase 1-like [Trifolium pratense]|uniref:cold-responsive protein kinase 1-like n=1 Tax=Trifolium pratense TaxID=57577 RepID=UPI001E695A18|nr:cold-responsive protein kinase 1-like [Trifolium pratense]
METQHKQWDERTSLYDDPTILTSYQKSTRPTQHNTTQHNTTFSHSTLYISPQTNYFLHWRTSICIFFSPGLSRHHRFAVTFQDIMSCGCFRASTLKRSQPHIPHEIDGYPLENVVHFSEKDLRLATDNYHPSKKIGRGGFGTVYQGTLKDGRQVAVKSLSAASKQGVREFLTEIKTISLVKHPNLVELIGCCVQEPNRTLVYEFVENNNLDRALLGNRSTNIKLGWEKRSNICTGTARGLAFLHGEAVPHIVHRDIKASNILLDRDFNPKIGDFGLAKLFPEDITHISTRIAGTTGYLAPEYAMGGQLTMKADVYSFGVLILEVISGQSSARTNWGGSDKFLLEWAWQLHEEGKLLELVDPEMVEYPKEEVIRYMKVAFFCTQAAASRRPSMSQVVDMLSKTIRLNEKQLTAPGFFQTSEESSLKKSSIESTSYQFSSAPASITQITPR